MRTDRVNFLDLLFDRLTFKEVEDLLRSDGRSAGYRYVVTPNVDHVVRIDRQPKLRALYNDADVCVCDSRVLRLLARLCGVRLTLVPGSDLTAHLLSEVVDQGDRIAIVGGSVPAVDRLRAKFPGLEVVHHEPPMGLRDNSDARSDAAQFVASAGARFTFLAVGSPQQEMIAREVRGLPGASGTALCIGAALDFLTDDQKRAPRALQKLGLEWAHRLASDPARLWRRYLVDGMRVFPIVWRWRRARGRKGATRTWAGIGVVAALVAGVAIYAARSNGSRLLPQGTKSNSITVSVPSPGLKLPPPNLLRPLTPEQAVEENVDRPFVARPDSPASKFVLKTDAADRERAVTCLTQAVYYEAAGEGVDGGRAVAQVVLNRLQHPGFPTTVCGVVYQGAERTTGCQFTFTCDGSLQRSPVAGLWARSRKIAEEALAGRVFGPVGHATHYHADYVLPYWADSLDKSVQIARHIFYRLPGSLGDRRAFFQRYAGSEPALPQPASDGTTTAASTDTERLADILMSDSTKSAAPEVEKVIATSSPLLADSSQGTLIGDVAPPAAATPKRGKDSGCVRGESKQLAPLGSNDLRAGAGSPSGC